MNQPLQFFCEWIHQQIYMFILDVDFDFECTIPFEFRLTLILKDHTFFCYL